MKISFKYNRNHLVYMLGALLLAGIVLVYLFMYLPSSESYLNERRFMALQRMKNNVDTRLRNSFQLMEPLAKDYDSGNTFVQQYFTHQFEKGKLYRFDSAWRQTLHTRPETYLLPPGDYGSDSTSVRDGRIRFITTRYKKQADNKPGKLLQLAMSSDASEFVKDLVPVDAFSQFVVVADSTIIYETFPSGLQNSLFDSLAMINKVIGGASTRSIDLAGTGYLAFIQPFSLGKASRRSMLIGLLEKRQYLYERNQLPESTVIALIIAASILLILLPWFKIFGMGERDKLRLSDAVMAFLVCMLLVSGVFLVFATSSNRYHQERERKSLSALADSIEHKSRAYLDIARRQLRFADALMVDQLRKESTPEKQFAFLVCTAHDSKEATDTVRRCPKGCDLMTADKSGWPTAGNPKICWTDTTTLTAYFDSIGIYLNFLLDKTGMEKFRISNNQQPGNLVDYSARPYFKRQRAGLENYSLVPLISWTAGSFRTILSSRSEADTGFNVACLSFKLRPLEDVILPAGYSFAVVDGRGEVLYHSKPERSLNEHLPAETTDEHQVMAMVHQRQEGFIATRYHGRRYDLFIRPLNIYDGNAPLSIVVMEEKQFDALRQTGAFSLTVGLMLLLTVLNALLVLGMIVASSRKTLFGSLNMETIWVWPRVHLKSVYWWSAWYNLVLVIILLLLYPYLTLKTFIYVSLLSTLASLLMTLGSFAKSYAAAGRDEYRAFKMRAIRMLLGITAGLLILALMQVANTDGQVMMVLLFVVLAAAAGWLIFRWGVEANLSKIVYAEAGSAGLADRKNKWLFHFSVMMLTRLVLMSGIPITYMYKYGYDMMEKQEAAYRHHEYAQQWMSRHVQSPNPRDPALPAPVFYTDSYWLVPANMDKTVSDAKGGQAAEAETSDGVRHFSGFDKYMLNLFHPYRTPLYQEVLAIEDEKGGKESELPARVMRASGNGFTLHSTQPLTDNDTLRIDSSRLGFDYPAFNRLDKIMHWLLLAIMLLVMLHYINQLLRRIFVRNLPGDLRTIQDPKMLTAFNPPEPVRAHQQRFTLLHAYLLEDELIAVLGQLEGNRGKKIPHFDLINLPSQLVYENEDLIVLYHAETIVNNFKVFCRLNKELKKMLLSNIRLDIVVVSALPASELEERLRNNHKAEAEFPEQFTLFTTLLKEGQYETLAIAPIDERPDESAHWEQSHVYQLKYRSVWDSLTVEEKFLLHDVAEDGLVNGKDIYHLSLLLQKGLLVRSKSNGQLRIFSQGFRVFILSTMNENDVEQLKLAIRGTGTWTRLRTPLLVMTLTILSILFVTQQQAFSSIIGYFTAIAGVVPALTVVMGLLRTTKQGSSEG